MANGIYVASSGSKARLEQLETTSHNLANLMTAGFKRQEAVYREVHNEVHQHLGSPDQAQGVRLPNRFLPEDRINTSIDDRYTYWSQGILDETGNVLDIAIEGKGFFKVQDANGNQFLTRHGRFQLDEQGFVTNQSGLQVLDSSDRPLRLPLADGGLSVGYDGRVSVGETQLGALALVDVGDGSNATLNGALTLVGESLYRVDDPNAVERKATGLVRQGFMEGSNVNAVKEMVSLLSSSRLFEYSQKAMQNMADMDNQAVRDVSRLQG
ncbi:MAG: flagellar hook-basal body protein [Deltaproteobacteria bacterium]|nr:flagellar hook-basal body protein [Deltaproteobacteria bacterium]